MKRTVKWYHWQKQILCLLLLSGNPGVQRMEEPGMEQKGSGVETGTVSDLLSSPGISSFKKRKSRK